MQSASSDAHPDASQQHLLANWLDKIRSIVQWRDVFTAANFFIATVGSAFAVDIGHLTFGSDLQMSDGHRWGGACLMMLFALCALASIVWSAALLFAHDGLFKFLRVCSIGLSVALLGLSAAALDRGLIVSASWFNEPNTEFTVKISVITVLIICCELICVLSAKKMLDDVTDAEESLRNGEIPSSGEGGAVAEEYDYD